MGLGLWCLIPLSTIFYVVLGYNSTYFSNKIQKGKTCYSKEQVISMLELLIDNIFVSFGEPFQQVVGIPMGTILPLFYPIYLYAHMSWSFFKILLKTRRFMKLEPLISHTGILMTSYLSIILDLQNFFHS